eukprot:4214262-Prymnesium_polylepis.1
MPRYFSWGRAAPPSRVPRRAAYVSRPCMLATNKQTNKPPKGYDADERRVTRVRPVRSRSSLKARLYARRYALRLPCAIAKTGVTAVPER